ncbi:protein kinase [Nocardia sp. CT2-14]|uniref:non-specific serine/threonine protein kinase n=2 Tax=Nocardia aurantiaca TaxID=2675850 RepID=A0A6I3KRK0_9NOCA|nr:protein kinase [Nocardia aurantiaca]
MGQVWLAEDTHLEREVALKLLPTELATDEDYRRRFEREARLAARLRGPHVVPIHAFGELDGRLYIDMELIEGSDLGKTLREAGALPPDRAVDLITQIAEALDMAHRAGLVHRDVKPSNVLTLPNGFAYLIDFGIARGVGQATITSTGIAVGTWAYMAPERYSGTEDLRSDVYSLACLLYETLTGAKPFGHTDPVQQVAAHLTSDPPRASDRNSLIPAALDAVMVRGLAKDPAHRFPSAGALAAAARAALESQPAPRPSPHRPADPTAKWDSGDPFPSYGSGPAARYAAITPPPARNPTSSPYAYTAMTPPPGGPSPNATPPPGPGSTPAGPTQMPAAGASDGGMAAAATPPSSDMRSGAMPASGVWPAGSASSGGRPVGATPPPGRGSPGSVYPVGGAVGAAASVPGPPPGVAGLGSVPTGIAGGSAPPSSAPPFGGMSTGAVPGGSGYVSPYAAGARPTLAAYSGIVGKPMERARIRPWQPVWWVVLALCTLFFAIMTVGVLGVTFTEGFGDALTTVIAYLVFVGPLFAFAALVIREIRKFRAERGR